MSRFRPIEALRRWLPQTVRMRLSILYASLFLGAGALLLGLTYGLVASSLPNTTSLSTLTPNQQAKIRVACQLAVQAARSKGVSAPTTLRAWVLRETHLRGGQCCDD